MIRHGDASRTAAARRCRRGTGGRGTASGCRATRASAVDEHALACRSGRASLASTRTSPSSARDRLHARRCCGEVAGGQEIEVAAGRQRQRLLERRVNFCSVEHQLTGGLGGSRPAPSKREHRAGLTDLDRQHDLAVAAEQLEGVDGRGRGAARRGADRRVRGRWPARRASSGHAVMLPQNDCEGGGGGGPHARAGARQRAHSKWVTWPRTTATRWTIGAAGSSGLKTRTSCSPARG